MEICRRRSRRHYKVPVDKVNFKILQYHEITREEGPKKTTMVAYACHSKINNSFSIFFLSIVDCFFYFSYLFIFF